MPEPRRATREDMPACAAVVNAWIDATDWMPRVYDAETIERFFHDGFDAREFWVLGDPIYAYASFNPETKQLVALYSSEPGRGVGKALMDAVKAGRDYLWLTTHEPNLRAQKFYAREGFVEVSRHDPEPPEVVREVRFEWSR
ncbi:GNAT family N-acetyltransferase [Pseudaestuariivita atlantica]|uniref:GNAT family acetyltransferase n=1 Tax=Pseudaestuariivita atlantica TaxID=1317121 RepID=A0A0L1JNY1_9RHOB|nr:GNAT family N-acetyltransferase [Pseudaestuariivita atlantica]KNG93464.1 GNAT family acetyltransferase [Pseudaestuariivita atlantica]